MTMGLVIHAPLLFWAPDFAKVFGIDNIVPAEEWVNIMGRFINSFFRTITLNKRCLEAKEVL